MEDLSKVLRYLKTRMEWTNEQCANNCGISLAHWKQLLSGKKTNPRWDIMVCLAHGFQVPIDYFNGVRDERILTMEEIEHMRMYRSLPVSVQAGIQALVEERYAFWQSEYKKSHDYGYRLAFRQKCAKLPITKIKKLLKLLEDEDLCL